MEELLLKQDRMNEFMVPAKDLRPVIRRYERSEVPYYGCQLFMDFRTSPLNAMAFAETPEIALAKAEQRLMGRYFNLSYPMLNLGFCGLGVSSEQSIAFDRALRAFSAQTLLQQSFEGVGIPLQIPVKESGFVISHENQFNFSNYCLFTTEEALSMALVLAVAQPKEPSLGALTMGVGCAKTLEDSMRTAWDEVFEKVACQTLFFSSENELPLVHQFESLSDVSLKNWLSYQRNRVASAFTLEVENINKEILFADRNFTIVRISSCY